MTTELIDNASPAPSPPAVAARCENCDAPLQGEYCHVCGQSVQSPLRHALHALEEVFESFWHLDGRIFRTLRYLPLPGRVARDYIAGHRARYVAPLRLFVILSVLTFFVAQFSVQLDDDTIIDVDPDSGINVGPDKGATARAVSETNSDFKAAKTVAEVERIRDRELANIERARALIPKGIPAGTVGMDIAMSSLRANASRRIKELGGEVSSGATKTPKSADATDATHASARPGSRSTTAPPNATTSAASSSGKPVANTAAAARGDRTDDDTDADADAKPDKDREAAWDANANPITISWLPAFANRWLTSQSDRASHNVVLIRKDPQRYMRAVIGAVPSTLFVLVPVFALLLKIFYLFKRRLYMEHLVVALYSHAFLLLCLLGIFASMALRHSLGPQTPWLGTIFGWIEGLLWAWMPIYLLLMQKAIYRQGWPMTLLKYCVLGTIYFMLLSFGAAATFFYSLLRM